MPAKLYFTSIASGAAASIAPQGSVKKYNLIPLAINVKQSTR